MDSYTIVAYNDLIFTASTCEPGTQAALFALASLTWEEWEATREERELRMRNLMLYGTSHPEIFISD